MQTCRWKSCPTRARAGESVPSLAGVAVTRGLKRRQGLCGMRDDSPEIQLKSRKPRPLNWSKAIGRLADMPGSVPAPGSWSASRTKGRHRNLGGPAGAAGEYSAGVVRLRGKTRATHRAEAGRRTGS